MSVLVVKVGDITHGEGALLPGNRRGELLTCRTGLNVGGWAGL